MRRKTNLIGLFIKEVQQASQLSSPEKAIGELCILTLVKLEGGTAEEAQKVWKRLQPRQIPRGPLALNDQIVCELLAIRSAV